MPGSPSAQKRKGSSIKTSPRKRSPPKTDRSIKETWERKSQNPYFIETSSLFKHADLKNKRASIDRKLDVFQKRWDKNQEYRALKNNLNVKAKIAEKKRLLDARKRKAAKKASVSRKKKSASRKKKSASRKKKSASRKKKSASRKK